VSFVLVALIIYRPDMDEAKEHFIWPAPKRRLGHAAFGTFATRSEAYTCLDRIFDYAEQQRYAPYTWPWWEWLVVEADSDEAALRQFGWPDWAVIQALLDNQPLPEDVAVEPNDLSIATAIRQHLREELQKFRLRKDRAASADTTPVLRADDEEECRAGRSPNRIHLR
jgi:hypothetical protein